MKIFATCLRGALLTLGIAAAQSCSQQAKELPSPVATATATGVSIAEAQNWYQATYPGLPTATAPGKATASRTAPIPTAQLAWQRALTTGTGAQQLILVPFAGDAALFAHGSVTGLRYLLVAQ